MAEPSDFLCLFEKMSQLAPLWPSLSPSDFNVSTMTVLADSDQTVQLDALKVLQEDDSTDLLSLLRMKAIHADCPTGQLTVKWTKRRKKKPGEFGNQMTLEYSSWSNRSIKVFSHGGVHVTGCKNLVEFRRICRVVGGLLFGVGAMDEWLSLGPPRVVMLNFNFSLKCELNLAATAQLIRSKLRVPCTHETETHPAVMAEFRFRPGQKTTAMIFRSGGVLVSSSSQLSGVHAAFRLICQFVNDNLEEVRARVTLNGHGKKRHGVKRSIDGYPIGQALACLRPF